MNIKELLLSFVTTFALTLVVAAVVSFLYSLIVHSTGTADWEHSFRLAFILGIILTWLRVREGKEKAKTE